MDMTVTYVALQPPAAAAGCPALTPELLAATGARYSRSNEGLAGILARIDPADPDRSVDSIFRMVDYGHQSIADMAPVALFMDGLSMILGYLVWSLCPTAGGQESSTRYIDLGPVELPDPEELGLPAADAAAWREGQARALAAYREALELWQALARACPELMRLPPEVVADVSEKGRRKAARLERNYAFDRARYFLPAAARTNVMLVMSARGWVQLCQHLCSHPWPEAVRLGERIRGELQRVVPRLLKHARATPSATAGLLAELAAWRAAAAGPLPPALADVAADPAVDPAARLEVSAPREVDAATLADDLRFHDHRYAWVGAGLRRTAVRFGWRAVAMAEIRDLNRHRTGSKHCPLVPLGFYCAADQVPASCPEAAALAARLAALRETGRALSATARRKLAGGDPAHIYWTLLGTQFAFEHTTTADKFIYEAELRTGTGSHFRYARHLHDALELWYARYPATRGLILEGTAEPE
jgi:thymidylate synthase ThyX